MNCRLELDILTFGPYPSRQMISQKGLEGEYWMEMTGGKITGIFDQTGKGATFAVVDKLLDTPHQTWLPE